LHIRLHRVQWAFVIKGATLFEKVPLKFEDGIAVHEVKIVKE
jgi:hypothetical protein